MGHGLIGYQPRLGMPLWTLAALVQRMMVFIGTPHLLKGIKIPLPFNQIYRYGIEISLENHSWQMSSDVYNTVFTGMNSNIPSHQSPRLHEFMKLM